MDEADLDASDAAGKDIGAVKIPITTTETDAQPGTTVELTQLRPGFEQPNPKRLRSILLREFGLPSDFEIFIDGEQLTADAIEGDKVEVQLELPDGTEPQVTVRFLPSAGTVADTGVALRVDGRMLDRSPDFGLVDDPDVPRGALRRVYIEVIDDGLRDDVTADWSGVIDSSERLRTLRDAVSPVVKEQILRRLESESPETEDQFVQRWEKQEQLELLPFTQRERLMQALRRVFSRYFSENRERRDVAANLVIDVFREEPYWLIARRIDEIKPQDVLKLAEVLSEWGFGNMAEISRKALARLRFLDEFTKLILNPSTGEFKGIHPVLQTNPWLFGDEFELMISNRQINTIVKNFCDGYYRGDGGADRPDLIMMDSSDQLLLVELKSPQDTLDWDNEAQAKKYRDRLAPSFPGKRFSVFVLGGSSPPEMVRNADPKVKLLTYKRLVADAEARLRWLISNIDVAPQPLPELQPDFGI